MKVFLQVVLSLSLGWMAHAGDGVLKVSPLDIGPTGNFCGIYNPGQHDLANRYCDGSYGVVLGGYIVDNTCYYNLEAAYQKIRETRACNMAPPIYYGSCQLINPGVRDSGGRYCDKTYGVLFQGAIANNTCYYKVDDALSAMENAPYCRGGGTQPMVSLRVNGTHQVQAGAGQTVYYQWSSQGVSRVESYYYANGGDSCSGGFSYDDYLKGNRKPWVAHEANQAINLSAEVQTCQRGLTYTIVMVGYGLNGSMVQDQIQVYVP